MNNQIETGTNGNGQVDDVGRLIQHVGAREAVPEERMDRARGVVRAHWEQEVASKRPRQRAGRPRLFAFAASLAAIFGVAFVLWNQSAAPPVNALASVDRVLGEVSIAGGTVGPGSMVKADSTITTGLDSRVALRLSGGQSLRIDTTSQVVLHSPNHVSLESGAIYIDSDFAADKAPVLVSTPMGTAQDIGTQFQVRMTETAMVVAVRDGLVKVAQAGKRNTEVEKGYFVTFDADGEPREQTLAADDPEWDWVETVTPEFRIQGATLEEYLRWYAHEAGVSLAWADDASESNARKTRLAGTITGASLDESLDIVKRIAPFEYRLSDGQLWVRAE